MGAGGAAEGAPFAERHRLTSHSLTSGLPLPVLAREPFRIHWCPQVVRAVPPGESPPDSHALSSAP